MLKRFLPIAVALVLIMGNASAETDWLSPFKQLVSPTEAAEREAARAEHKARKLEEEAAKIQEAAEAARLEAEAAKDKATDDSVLYKRATSKTEPVKTIAERAPEPAAIDSGEKSAWNPLNWKAPAALNPMTWLGDSDEKSTQAATARPKAFREDALNLQAVSAPATTVVKPEEGKSEKLAAKANAKQKAVKAEAVTDTVVLETEKGNIYIELYSNEAPLTVANFKSLVEEGFYNTAGMKFHRVVPGFVVQTGDPTGTGMGGSKKRIPLEVKNKLSHDAKGYVAMARGPDPDSATSQFYITLAPQKSLDGKYAIFGKVIGGLDVVDRVEKDTKLYGVRFVDPSKVVHDPAPQEDRNWKKWF